MREHTIAYTQLGPQKLEGTITLQTLSQRKLKSELASQGGIDPEKLAIEFDLKKNEGTLRDRTTGNPLGYFMSLQLEKAQRATKAH